MSLCASHFEDGGQTTKNDILKNIDVWRTTMVNDKTIFSFQKHKSQYYLNFAYDLIPTFYNTKHFVNTEFSAQKSKTILTKIYYLLIFSSYYF